MVLFLLALSATAATVEIDGRQYTVLTKARHDHFQLTLSLAKGERPAVGLDLVFAARDPGNYARLLWAEDDLQFTLTEAGRTRVLTTQDVPFPPSLRNGGTLVLRREPHRVELIAAGQRVCRFLAPGFGSGGVAVRDAGGRAGIADVAYQRVEPIAFGDDFMRTEEEGKNLGLWKPASGDWHMYSVMERIEANPDARIREGHEPAADRSPNPFCLSGSGEDGAYILTGQPFWYDYRVGVSVRSMDSEFGLLFGATDENNCWLARWRLHSLGVKPNLLELVRRENGKEQVVASAQVVGRARSWYRLEAIAMGSRIDVLVDGVSVIAHRDDRSVGGRIGLYAKGADETLFDDVSLASVPTVALDDATEYGTARRVVAGEWQVEGVGQDLREVATTGRREQALLAFGYDHWSARAFRAEATVEKKATAALVLGLRDDKNYLRAELDPRDEEARLVQVQDGRETTLAKARVDVPDGTSRLFVDVDAGKHVRFFVNGTLVVRQAVPEAPVGPVGLGASGKGTVRFGNVQAFASLERDWEHQVDIERFANDPFMQGWASPRYAWILAPGSDPAHFPQRYIHKGDFYGACRISLPVDDGIRLSFGGDSVDDTKRYELALHVRSPKEGSLVLTRDGNEVAQAQFVPGERKTLPGQQIVDEKIGALPKTPDTVSYGTLTLQRDGDEIWADIDGKELLALHEDKPLTGRTVTLDVPRPIDLLHVSTVRAQERDYLFEKAATDWVQVGTWEVTNRFACDPRWSHMNGRGKGTAALWNKLDFSGDFTLEYYAGMRMRQGEMHEGAAKMYYPRVGDINVAFNAQNMDLFSGYNVILQAWDPMWTEMWSRFMRRGEIIDKTDRQLIPRGRHSRPTARIVEVAWDPGGRPVHGAWYFVKIRKTGGRFDVSFDNVPVFSVTDRDPLAGRRIALWTQHNSIVIARAKIGYRQESRPTPKVDVAPTAETRAAVPVPYRLRGLTHPGLSVDFEQDMGGLVPYAGDQSAELKLVPRPKGKGQALRLENLFAGGDFGVVLPVDRIDGTRLSEIEFDYAIPKEAKLNLYVSLVERPEERWFVTLSGPDTGGPNLHRLGAFADADADGRWHHASFDLGSALRQALPYAGPLHIRSLTIGMLHEGYLNAGLGGNPQGSTWYLDNLALRSHGPKQALFAWTPLTTPAPARYRAWFAEGDEPTAMPNDATVQSGDSFTVDLPAAGDWLVQAAVESDGQWQTVPPVPVRVCEPVAIARTEPADRGAWDGGAIRLFLAPGNHAHLDLSQCVLKVADTRVPVTESCTVFDAEKGVLEFLPNLPGSVFTPGTDTPMEFVFADDLYPTAPPEPEPEKKADNPEVAAKQEAAKEAAAKSDAPKPRALPEIPTGKTTSHTWTIALAEKADRVPPSIVRLTPDCYRRLDFDRALGVIPLTDSEVLLQRVPRGDGHALRVVNRLCGSTFGAHLGWSGFDLGKNPILEFDYRVGSDANVAFQFQLFGRPQYVSLTDTDDDRAKLLGAIPDVVADETWRHARVDLTELIANSETASRRARSMDVGDISVGDFGYAGDAPGAWYELDNLNLTQVASAKNGLELKWGAEDASGIAGYSYVWDDQPTTEPDGEPETASGSNTFGNLPEGRQYFHIRAIDRAGNVGPANHYPFIIDNTPPQIVACTPTNGAKAAVSTIKVTFGPSLSRINTASTQIFVDKRRLSLRSQQTDWNPETRELSVDLLEDWNLMRRPFKDGQEVAVKISGAQDFAGNEAEPFEFSWHVDFSQDHEAPPAPYLWSYAGQFQTFDHFGNTRHNWRPYTRGTEPTTSAERVWDEGRRTWVLQVRKQEAGPRFGVHRYNREDLASSPQVDFDIRIMPGTKVNVLFYIEKKYYAVRLTGGDQLPVIGDVPGVKDDGAWHHVSFDACAMFRKSVPELEDLDARMCAIAGWSDGNEVGASFELDNFALIGPRPPLPLFNYSDADATGISSYKISFDQNPTSTAGIETASSNNTKELLAADKPGMWYVHAAARDGAGNWSETVHYPYLCTAPVPESRTEGLEADATWRSASGRGRVRGYVYKAGTPSGNKLLGVQIVGTKEGELDISSKLADIPLAGDVKLTASVYSGASTPLNMHAVLKAYNGRKLTSESVELKPETWSRNVRFVFPEALPKAKDKVGERWTLSLLVDVGKRSRDVLVFDEILLSGDEPVEPNAPAAGK
jgi:hypothetical protein